MSGRISKIEREVLEFCRSLGVEPELVHGKKQDKLLINGKLCTVLSRGANTAKGSFTGMKNTFTTIRRFVENRS